MKSENLEKICDKLSNLVLARMEKETKPSKLTLRMISLSQSLYVTINSLR